VIAKPESWSRPAEPARAAGLALAALALFGAAWVLLHVGFYTHDQIVDTPVYQRYGDAIAHGQVPYRDFDLEYPPGALPVFALPALGHDRVSDFDGYRVVFESLMFVCGLAVVALAAVCLRSLGRASAAPLVLVALFPLLLGSVVLSRFDLYPTAITVGALAALFWDRDRLGAGLLGLGAATKIFPALLLPLALAWTWRRRGRREALVCGGIFLGVVALVFLPFTALSPDGMRWSLARQLTRPLQIETLGSAILLGAHQAFGLAITMKASHGSQNLDGTLPNVLAAFQTVLQVLALVAIWVAFARGPATRERLVRYSAAAICAFVALGKVLSPQFLIWLVPLVALVGGRRGLWAAALLVVAMVLTQLWFPYRYWDLALHFDAFASWLVLLRDLVLVGLLCVLTLPALRARGEPARTT
jgi:uncharacterized membrane protein